MFQKAAMSAAIYVGIILSASAAGTPPVPARTAGQGCIGVQCQPARTTFGYYPTTWRRWPLDKIPTPPKPTPEAVATPPTTEKPKAEEKEPTVVPEEGPTTPSI